MLGRVLLAFFRFMFLFYAIWATVAATMQLVIGVNENQIKRLESQAAGIAVCVSFFVLTFIW